MLLLEDVKVAMLISLHLFVLIVEGILDELLQTVVNLNLRNFMHLKELILVIEVNVS